MSSLYASVVRLDRKACKALKITDAYSLHRVVYSLFEDTRSSDEKKASVSSGIQWVEKSGNTTHRQILMLSNRPPKGSVDGEYGEVISKPLPEGFLSHKTYRFEVTINPVRRDNQSRKLIPVKGREAIAQWFIERGKASWGFEVNQAQLQIESTRILQFKAKHEVTIQQVKMNGYLSVTDTETFIRSVTNGIGRGRSFGCGLLQVVPVQELLFN